MPIYTKTGDSGTTGLFNGRRIQKSSLQIEALGSLDELSSLLGFAASVSKKEKKLLSDIQKDLCQIMCFLGESKTNLSFIEKRVLFFEKTIDLFTEKLLPLKNFVLPWGTTTSCWFHTLRTVCRRSERVVVRYFEGIKKDSVKNNQKLKIYSYLNRLSDLFFTLSRRYNNQEKVIIIK